MNKKILAAAVLAVVSGSAMADNAQLYGILDFAGISSSNAGTTNSVQNTQSLTGVADGTWLPSLWGMKGSEDLGDGLSANFQLESNLSSISGGGGDASLGVNNGKLFDRFATVGLSSSEMGTIRFGEMLDPTFLESVVEQARGVTHSGNLGLKMILTYGNNASDSSSSIAGVMSSNWIMYNSPKISDVTVDVGYKSGNVAGAQSNSSGSFLAAHYVKNGLTINVSTQNQNDSNNQNKLTKNLVGAMYTFGDLTVEGQWQSYRSANALGSTFVNASSQKIDATGTQFGVAYNLTPKLQLSAQYDAVNDNTLNVRPTDLTIGANYALGSHTHLYALYENAQSGAVNSTQASSLTGWSVLYAQGKGGIGTQSAVALGINHVF